MDTTASRLALLLQVPAAAHAATAVVLVGCLVVVLRARGRLRRGAAGARAEGGVAGDAAGVARVLEARGLASAEALRGMSAREQRFLLDQATPAMGSRAILRTPAFGPAIVRSPRPTPGSRGATSGAPAGAKAPRRVHCPACGAAFGPGVTAPVVAPCPRCGRRVSAHVEGARLVVTVEDDSGRGPRRS